VAAPPFSPDDAQRQVLDHQAGPLLVTGPAGTGKTTVLRERFARLLETGADPERTVLVVGTIRARDTARTSLLERLPASLPGLQVLTVHGLAHRVLKERFGALGYTEPPEVLSAAEQFAKVRELLDGQDPEAWPAYGHLLSMRGFADEVRGFLLRAQEELRTPEEIETAAGARGLTGWQELARFLREYQEVLDDLNAVDFAALVQRAAAALAADPTPTVDHVLVDDYQDTTLAAEALLRGLGAGDLVVAANPDAHVFSFQGTTRLPLERFAAEAFPGAAEVTLATAHRPRVAPTVEAWVAPHSSEEHTTIARELRRLRVDEGLAWSQMAVVVRRQGPHVAGVLRALDDARVPRAIPERGLSLTSQPATIPYVLALRWLVADATARDELIEPLLTSDVVGLSPAAARGLIRLAKTTGPGPRAAGNALDRTDGLAPEEATAVEAARATLTKAALFAGMSVQDAFKVLWEELPCSTRLVAEGGPALDVVVTFANVISDASEQGDASVAAFLEALDAGEHGPGWAAREAGGADAVQVLTAHGAAGLEFDTVIVADAAEGSFPSLGRPEPMFDLAVLARVRSRSEHLRERLEDERRLFRLVLGRARRRAVLVVADTHPDSDELATRSRFVDELDGVTWTAVPGSGVDDPVSTREAATRWRRELADPGVDAWRRLAALEGLLALGVDPARWWFTREWTETGRPLHDTLRLSYSRLSTLENCELEHVLGDELGLGRPAGYQAWVGKLVHGLIEDIETGRLGRTKGEILAELDARWREQEFPSKAVAHAFRGLVEERMLPNWWYRYGEDESLANERFFEFEFEGATIVGVIDRIGTRPSGGTRITDFKTGNPDNGPKAEESLQLGIYYLAVQECDDLAEFRPVRAVELAYVKGHWKTHELVSKTWMISDRDAEPYQQRVRAALAQLIARKKDLIAGEVYRPNPAADCHWCEFRSLCPLWPEGQPLFDVEVAR
jgi:superfamily I DNA/RNA helicase/RecB family exonuclease